MKEVIRGATLEVKQLTKSFGAVIAVDRLSVQIPGGSLCGILGPNGSGKSTLFDCCTGLERASSGSVLVDGEDIGSWPMNKIARQAGVVRSFQRNVVLASMSVEENLILAGQTAAFPNLFTTFLMGSKSHHRMTAIREEADALIDKIGLDPVRNSLAAKISVGQQRLLQFASALMARPRVLMLDEPLAGVSPVLIERLLETIRWAHRELKLTILLIEHNIDAVTSICPRIIVLNAGVIIADGSPQDVTSDIRVKEAYLGL